MALQFNPLTGQLDLVGTSSGSGSVPLGTLSNPFPASGSCHYSADGSAWLVSVDDTGHLVTTKIVATGTGSPYGLLLSLTQP